MLVIELNKENFEKEVNNSQMPVLIDFWASWCGPCKMMSPVIDEIANETQETLKVCKVNVDDELELARKFNIMSIPTFVAIKEGKVIGTTVGVQTKQQIRSRLVNILPPANVVRGIRLPRKKFQWTSGKPVAILHSAKAFPK